MTMKYPNRDLSSAPESGFKNRSEGYREAGSKASATLDLGRIAGEIETGLIHIDDDANELPENLGATERPLNELLEREFCPRSKLLASVNASLK